MPVLVILSHVVAFLDHTERELPRRALGVDKGIGAARIRPGCRDFCFMKL